MLQVLLVQNEEENCIDLVNKINSINEIKIYKVVFNKEDLVSILTKALIDILIIDYKIFKDFNIIEFYKISANLRHIIVLSNNSKICISEDKKCTFTSKKSLTQVLTSFVNKRNSNNKKIDVRTRIANELNYLGYNFSYNGSKYLVECIYYLYTDTKSLGDMPIKNVYEILSKKYNRSANSIKCSINRATASMYCECEEERLMAYLGLCYLPKVGARIIINAVLGKLNNKN